MPTTITLKGNAIVDGVSGSIFVDTRPYGGGLSGPVDVLATQLNAIHPAVAPTLTDVVVGSAPGGVRYAAVVLRGNGGTSQPSPVAGPITVASGHGVKVTSPSADAPHSSVPGERSNGATFYDVYAGTTAGALTKQNSSPVAIGTDWTEPSSGLASGAALPTADSTAFPDGPITITITAGIS
jgi:hypothetical protein